MVATQGFFQQSPAGKNQAHNHYGDFEQQK